MNRTAIVLLAVAACGKADKSPPVSPPLTPSTVELVKPGAEPRAVLHYALAKGVKTTIELAVDVELAASGMGGPVPTLVMTMEIGADDVLPDGRMLVRSTVAKVTARDRTGSKISSDTMAQQAGLLVGIGVVAKLSPNGTLSDAHLDFGAQHLPPEMQDQLGSLTKGFERVALALPDVAVGAGAVWRTKKEIEESGAHMTATTTIEITAIEGSLISYTRTVDVTGPDQTIQQMGVAVTMKNISGKGSGHGKLDLSRMVLDGEMSDELHQELRSQTWRMMTATFTVMAILVAAMGMFVTLAKL